MRRAALFASVACLGLAFAMPARAQLTVIDPASIAARAQQALTQLQQLRQQYQMLQQQYDGIMRTVNILSHPNQVLGIARGMMQQQIRSPGSTPGNIPGLAFGSQLSGTARRFMDQNRYYAPQGDDFGALEMQRREQATANMQAEVQTGLERADERLTYLAELQDSIPAQPDVTALAALEARISTEKTFLANEGNNMARLQLIQQTQLRVDANRAEQAGRKDADEWHARASQVFGEE